MSVADLFNTPDTDEEMATWSQLHFAHHVLINQAILEQHNVALPMYLINPVNLEDAAAFLNLHQQLHTNADQVLGVASQNLLDVDWNDPGQREGWIQLNAQLHVAEANATGVF